ncbi:DUF6461 domain-containing protein [Streptosporangium amethystogenes]|uniref:DUF6461 domain-containing protein n=1 Tax=Streptosporangium amethystogenes TaxID=2002 RepID=UPI0004C67CAD|nr:DUF6461 domain-containing protein [Streptosporangium amethystogenes]
MSRELLGHYRNLLQEQWLLKERMCVTWTRESPVREVALGYSADLGSTEPRRLSEVSDEADEKLQRDDFPNGGVILIGTLGDWSVVLEPNGLQGARPEVLRGLSLNSETFYVYCGSDISLQFGYWRGGESRVEIRPDGAEGQRWGKALQDLDASMGGLSWAGKVNEWKAAAFALAERVTGVTLDLDWLRRTHTRYAITRYLPDDLVPWEYENHPVVGEPDLAPILADPPGHLEEIIALASRTVVAALGLRTPVVDAVLGALPLKQAGDSKLREELSAFKRQLSRERKERGRSMSVREARLLEKRILATDVLAGALDPNPRRAAMTVTRLACKIRADEDSMVLLEVLYRCAVFNP